MLLEIVMYCFNVCIEGKGLLSVMCQKVLL